jgi:hypothetical protein
MSQKSTKQTYKATSSARPSKLREPKINMKTWEVDPRRVHADLMRTA